jgi:Predicted metal-dependent membrane protease
MPSNLISRRKRIILLVTYFVGYLFIFQWLSAAFIYPKFGYNGYLLADALVNGFILVFFTFLLNDWLAEQWKQFTKNIVHSLSTAGTYYLLLFAVNILFTLLIASPAHLVEAENQMNNEMMMKINLFGFLLSSLIVAPFAEEIIFRGCIYHPAAKKWGMIAGAVLSGLLFGALHVMASVESGNWINLLYIINYGMCGYVLAMAFGRTNSIWTSILVHALFNLTGIISMF